jgi:predicted dehydrogenase
MPATARVKLAVIFQARFLPAVQILKSAIDRNRLGRIIVGDAYVKWYRTRDYYEAAWAARWLWMAAAHYQPIDSYHRPLQHFVGPVASVFDLSRRNCTPH